MPAQSDKNGQPAASTRQLMTDIRLKRPEDANPAHYSARLHQAYLILARSLLRQALAASQELADDGENGTGRAAFSANDSDSP